MNVKETGPPMRIGITSGPTRAWLDPVRYLANASTGRLGSLIAERLAASGASIDYVVGPGGACPPTSDRVVCHEVEGVSDLMGCIEDLALRQGEVPYRAWIHAMAVLDYVPIVTSPHKIVSAEERLHLTLRRTPKVIAHFKRLFPESLLVGFKLTSPIDPDHLRAEADRLAQENGCDLVVANPAPFQDPSAHQAFFWEPAFENWTGPYQGKENIAQELVAWLERRWDADDVQ
jgi:phosphopantothenoylcysteine synthetase/decarboxylase